MFDISIVLWSGGVILAAIAVIVFVLYFRGTFRDRIEYKLINVPSPDREASRKPPATGDGGFQAP